MTRKKFKTIRCSSKAFESLDFLAKVLNVKKSAFLDELLDQLVEIFNEYRKGANIMYTLSRNQLIINSYGKSNIISGVAKVQHNATETEEDEAVRAEVEPVFNKGSDE